MMKKYIGLLATAAFAVAPIAAEAQTLPGAAGQAGYSPPQVSTIGNGDLFPDVVGGFPQAESYWASGATLLGYQSSKPSIFDNAIIGGDGTTNLWQRGTAGVSTTSAAVAWDSADRWGQYALSSAGVKIVQDSTAADLPTGFKYAIALTHTNSTGGQICMPQAVESLASYQFQGQVAELDFHAATGAGYTGGSTLTAYITYGTGTDEGANKMAFTVNAGGATGWAGGANATAAVIPLSAVSTLGRFAAVANIPATATEIGVTFCYTAGTTSANDYVAFSGIQLVRSPQLSKYASATAGYQTDSSTPLFAATGFQRRNPAFEAGLQNRYYVQINEPAASKAVATGNYQTATICDVVIPLVFPMRITPTVTIGGTTESATTWAVMVASTTPAALASTYLVVDAVVGSTNTNIALQATTAAKTAGFGCTLVGAGGGANIQANAEL